MPKKSDSAPPSSPPLPPEDWHYETSVAEIETIINRIESGELELEDVFEQFAQAVESLGQCETFLVERQSQVQLLIETLGDPPSA
jgi:exodeoxyribonuclease VII small subunit